MAGFMKSYSEIMASDKASSPIRQMFIRMGRDLISDALVMGMWPFSHTCWILLKTKNLKSQLNIIQAMKRKKKGKKKKPSAKELG